MVISAYQVNNVLRVYGDQLRQGKMSHRAKAGLGQVPDKVSISSEAKKNAIIDRIASNVLERVTRFGPDGQPAENETNIETTVFEMLQDHVGRQLKVDKAGPSEFIFKEISEDGETTHALSIEDSKFLTHKLKNIIKETVDESLI